MNNGQPLPGYLQRSRRLPLSLDQNRKKAAQIFKELFEAKEMILWNACRVAIIKKTLNQVLGTKNETQDIFVNIVNKHKTLKNFVDKIEEEAASVQSYIDYKKETRNEILAEIRQLEAKSAKLPSGTHLQQQEGVIHELNEEIEVNEKETEQFSEFLAEHDDIETLQHKFADKEQSIRKLQVELKKTEESLDDQKPKRKKSAKKLDWGKYYQFSQVSSSQNPDDTEFHGRIEDSSDSS